MSSLAVCVRVFVLQPYPPNPDDSQLNNFNHIFGGGYAAGYYRYTPGVLQQSQ